MAQRIHLVCVTLAKFCSQKKVYCEVKSPLFKYGFLQCRLCQSTFTVFNREIVCQNIVGSVAMYEA